MCLVACIPPCWPVQPKLLGGCLGCWMQPGLLGTVCADYHCQSSAACPGWAVDGALFWGACSLPTARTGILSVIKPAACVRAAACSPGMAAPQLGEPSALHRPAAAALAARLAAAWLSCSLAQPQPGSAANTLGLGAVSVAGRGTFWHVLHAVQHRRSLLTGERKWPVVARCVDPLSCKPTAQLCMLSQQVQRLHVCSSFTPDPIRQPCQQPGGVCASASCHPIIYNRVAR